MRNHIDTQVAEVEKFLSRANHLKIVLDNISKQSTTDKNDIYDLVYNKRKIENWLKLDIKNNDIKEDLTDILNRINTIINLLNSEDIDNILNKSVKNPSKLNKAKYEDKNKFKDLKDSGNKKAILDTNKGLNQYLRIRLPRLIIIGITLALLLFISNSNIIEDTITSIIPSNQDGENVSDEYTNDEYTNSEQDSSLSELTQEDVKPSTESMKDTMISLKNAISFIMRLIIMTICIINTLGLSLDVLYIFTYGQIGKPLDEYSKTLFSAEAIDTTSSLKEIIVDGDVNNKDRIEVAKALLNNMIQYINKVKGYILVYSIPSIDTDNNIRYAEDIMNELQRIKERTEVEQGINKVNAFVDAEIMYEYLESSIKNNKDWMFNVKKMPSLLDELEY